MVEARRIHDCCDAHIAVSTCCGFQRRFRTKAEKREALETYRSQLQNELTGVEQHLTKLDD